MLESLRAAQSTWVGKAVLAVIFILVIVGLSFFGIADIFRNRGGNWAAQVGGTQISADAYRQAYQNGLQELQQRARRAITSAQARQLGLDQQVLSRLVTDALLDRQAGKLGLAISDAQIGRIISEDPTFAGADGHFDRAKFAALLDSNRLTEQQFLKDQRQSYLRQELVETVAGGVKTPAAAIEALHDLQSETRSLDYVVLPPSLVGDIAAPDEATLQKFYDGRKAQFAAPEYRKLLVLALTPADVAKPDQVSADDIAKAYEAAPEAEFGAPERRTLQQIVFPNQTDAEAASLRIASGTSFADIAAERHVAGKDLDLGTVSKAQVFDRAIADAAFSLPDNGTSGPIAGTFGTVLVHVAGITPGTRKPLDEVAPILRTEIARSPARTRDALRDIHDKIEDARASGKTLAEAAKDVGLTVRTIDAVDVAGRDKGGATVDIPDREAVLRAAFASDVGVDNDVVQARNGDQVWFEVAGIDPAHQRPFAEVKPAVETAWRVDETAKRLAARADADLKQLQGGATLDQIAATDGNLPVQHANDVRRAGTTSVPPGVVLKAFDTPVGGFGSAEGADGTRILFKMLDSVVPPVDPASAEAQQLGQQYQGWLSDGLLTAYLTQLQGSVDVKINPGVIGSVDGAGS